MVGNAWFRDSTTAFSSESMVFLSSTYLVVESLNQAFPTIVTSGSILTCAGFLIGGITSNGVIASLGKTLGRGTLISIIMVMLFLPQLLMVFDKLIDKTALTRGERRRKDEA